MHGSSLLLHDTVRQSSHWTELVCFNYPDCFGSLSFLNSLSCRFRINDPELFSLIGGTASHTETLLRGSHKCNCTGGKYTLALQLYFTCASRIIAIHQGSVCLSACQDGTGQTDGRTDGRNGHITCPGDGELYHRLVRLQRASGRLQHSVQFNFSAPH